MECDAISQCESISLCIIGNGVIAGNSRNKSAIGSRLYKPFVQIENHVSSSCVRIYMGSRLARSCVMPYTTLPPGTGVPSERVLLVSASLDSPAASEVPSAVLLPPHAQSEADNKSAITPERSCFFSYLCPLEFVIISLLNCLSHYSRFS